MSKKPQNMFSLLHLACLSSLLGSGRASQVPLIDFDRMGTVGIAGSFVGFDFANSTGAVTYDPSTSTLLARGSDGSLTKVGSTSKGGSIVTGCPMGGRFYFGGSFDSIAGTNASNVAVYDPSKGTFSALGGGGLNGNTTSSFCDSSKNQVWFGGEFSGPSSGSSGYGGSVAVYDAKADSWSPPPFSGLNGPVLSIIPSPSSQSLFFSGSFQTTFSVAANSSNVTIPNIPANFNPAVPFSSGATPFSSSLVPIPLSSAAVDASPATTQSGFDNITNALCPAGADGPGDTWLAQDGVVAVINVRAFSFLTASGIRLGNTFVQGRGTKAFTVSAIPNNNVLTLNYTDPNTGEVHVCTNDCPLLSDTAVPYQDFLFESASLPITGIQIQLTQWVGAGSGLHLLQILSNGAFASSVPAQNGPSCFSPNGEASQVAQTGNWKQETVGTTIPATVLDVLVADVPVNTASGQGPTFTWNPYVSNSGTYNINLLVPGCTNLQDCPSRSSVEVTVSPGAGLPSVTTTVSQQVNEDTAQLVYSGPIVPTSGNFETSIKMQLAANPAGKGVDGNYEIVADRVQLVLIEVGVNGTSTSNSTNSGLGGGSGSATNGTTQTGFGFFEWPLASTATVNATGVLSNTTETGNDDLAFLLSAALGSGRSSASIKTVAVDSFGTIYVGGSFMASGSSNILAFKNGQLNSLHGGGLDGAVEALLIDGNNMFVAGSFKDTATNTGSGGVLRGVVRYDIGADKWNPLQAGVDGTVTSLNEVNGQLLLTGDFTTLLSSGNSTDGMSSAGFAVWNVSSAAWASSGGFLSGSMTLVANGTDTGGNTEFMAGNVASSSKFGGDGFVTLSNGAKGSTGPSVTPLKAQFNTPSPTGNATAAPSLLARIASVFTRQSTATTTLPAPPVVAAPDVLAGAFWSNSSNHNKPVTILGGNFSLTTSGQTGQSVAFYDSDKGQFTPLNGAQISGTVYTLLVQGNLLFIGGQFTAPGGTGFAIYDLDKQQWDPTAVQALQGSNIIVRSITSSTFKSNTIYVAGTFTGAGSLATCTGICALEVDSKQWSALGNGIQGEVASVDYASSNLELLVAGGAMTLNDASANVAMFDIANSSWSAVGDGSKLAGPVTAITVNNANSSSIFAAGPSGDNSGPFLNFWDGTTWAALSNSSFGSTSSIQQLAVVPLQENHNGNSIIESDRILMISGNMQSPSFGNASAALYDGQTFMPFIVTTSSTGALGTVAAVFRSLSAFSFNQHHFLATGVVILISIAIASGVVFLIALICILWTLFFRARDKDEKYLQEDDDSTHHGHPSSLLEHINAATRGAVLGTGGVISPFGDARKEKSSGHMTNLEDPFAADGTTQGGHDNFVPTEEGTAVGTAIGGDEHDLRQTHARYSFDGTGEGELALAQGTTVDVLDSHDSAWWYVRDANGKEGVVPASYLY